MSVRSDFSVSGHLQAAKVACASLAAIAAVTLVTFAARARWRTTSPAAKQASATAQPTPTAGVISYVRRARLSLQLRDALNALGDRLERPGKERLTLTGTLRRQTGLQATPFRLIVELPDRMRLEEMGTQSRVIGFDGSNGWVLGAVPSNTDQEMIETLVFDSAEHFFLVQTQGFAARALGLRFRSDDGTTARYTGPFYDIYQVADRVAIGSARREQAKLFYLNSNTQLLERVRYQFSRGGAAVNVEVRLGGWQGVNNQRLPHTIIREENGTQVLLLTVNAAVVGPRIADGIFGNPQGN